MKSLAADPKLGLARTRVHTHKITARLHGQVLMQNLAVESPPCLLSVSQLGHKRKLLLDIDDID